MASLVNGTAGKSIPELSREQIQELFSTSEKNLNQWFTVVPKDNHSLSCPPSQSKRYYLNDKGCNKEVVEHLAKSFEKIFKERAHVESYWEYFTLNVTHKLGLTFREIQRISAMLPTYNEAQLRHAVLNPILKEVSRVAYVIPDIKYETVNITFLVEETVDMIKESTIKKLEQEESEKQGQKPAVDDQKRGAKRAVDGQK